MESVRALDYRLDRNARNLSTKSSGLAGVVVRDMTKPWASAFVAGLERALSNSGYDMILKSTDGADVRARRAAGALDGLGAEGVIWCDGENFPGALSMPALCFGFTREGFHSLVMEEGGAPSFETGVLAASAPKLKIIAGKPVPGRELCKAPKKRTGAL